MEGAIFYSLDVKKYARVSVRFWQADCSADHFSLDVKPGNVMVDWNLDEQGQVQIERVALIDLDVSLKLKGNILLRIPGMQRLGNFMWRSPKAQTGQRIGKPSDVFSFGLVCTYTLTGREIMAVDHQEL
ncbi:uncharacterized protein BP5553_07011 [Venustampulla echinocandica]|uniref:Protein kinase domain-containing protein n=1 Tax=Venustampulla echinocandica TaxID=2656787 RepID=A0A370TIA4_9HELO|nr:uncharacterized protein BP5553_07011 [Venustampulla echinocandica]RDL35080.1 hypothetical protein BP5553_07011 [Venustampulla echinocandica]